MANKRIPLHEIYGNKTPRVEHSPYVRGQIIGMRDMGAKWVEIEEKLGVPESTCRSIYSRKEDSPEGRSQDRSGRPKSYTKRDERKLVREARLNPTSSYRELSSAANWSSSKRTASRVLSIYNIKKWLAKRRPKLTEDIAKLRVGFCQNWVNATNEETSVIIFSDECSVERGKGRRPMWVFRRPEQKWDKEMINPYPKGKQASVMVWASFSGRKGPSKLVVMTRDEDSARNGYSTWSYCKALDEGLVEYYEPGLKFMQDNAPIHTSALSKLWLEEHGVEVIEWPPYSPDLNPIEHMWKFLKEKLNDDYPELLHATGDKDTLSTLMGPMIIEAWRNLPQEKLDACWKSFQKRCQAVIDAKGWYTKY
jgi:hypothetical protein